MFVDYVKIKISSGNGGNGCVSFRREKFLPKGGPDGGNGGKGGNVIFKVDTQLHTLQDIKYRKSYRAQNGSDGSSSNKTGANGIDVTILVPSGTTICNKEKNNLSVDLIEEKDSFCGATGGVGGRGNASFATSTHQSPREVEKGQPGEEFIYELELKLLADVGLIGFPNVGKSTLLSKLSAARPKIADYPFTTLQPHLGIVKYGEFDSFVMVDIPGLIKGASDGKGMGIRFLRHIERTTVLAILVDVLDEEPDLTISTLLNELKNHNEKLLDRPRVIVFTKSDLLAPDSKMEKLINGEEVLFISSVSGKGISKLISTLSKLCHN
ncbi:MAG: GTPase ObgE [Candidatus Marinimicrobia bacterium]|nr:GTPase ObgE [Candidatus Neomarinimicrobiota bacterium]|tara:strand:- start:12590 stop:13561 length:972 start_codon:yes stop_codon:yes gene_type:complete